MTDTRRELSATLLSAFVPGTGQLLLGQRRKGRSLIFAFVALLFCMWPLRLPRFPLGIGLIVIAWLELSLYAACSALLEHRELSKWWLLVIPILTYVGLNLIFTPLFLASGFRALKFDSSAMETTLLKGDQFVIDNNYYRHHAVGHNDLVVLRRKDYKTVKRVLAIGGDTIEGRNRKILLNGQFIKEPFIQHTLALGTNPEQDTFGPFTIPIGEYFVIGDNRDVSLDSRTPDFGLLDSHAIIGRPLYIYRSPTKGRVAKKLH